VIFEHFLGDFEMADTVVYDKRFVRNNLARKRLSLTEAEVEAASEKICNRLSHLDALKVLDSCVFYYPFQNEVNLLPLALEMLEEGKKVYFPKYVPEDEKYVFARVYHLEDDFAAGKYGIPEPVETSDVYSSSDLQEAVWFVPGLGFDDKGNRLGRGGGYYDRFLHFNPGLSVAVGYDWQLLDSIPCEAHDAKVDALVTDKDQLIFIEKDFG